MVAIMSFVRAAALSSVFASTALAALPEALIFKRQDVNDTVGTNLYNCHDNCGEAILEEEVPGFCNSTIFSTDYAACLQCAGPDNENIWQYYGSYLTAGAIECGSATVPLSGTQADIGTAMLAQNASSTASGASATVANTAATTTAGTVSVTSASSSGASASPTVASASASTTPSGASMQSKSLSSFLVGGVSFLAVIVAASMA